MLVAIASTGDDLWFFKLTGPDELVTKERANFDAFLKSLVLDRKTSPTMTETLKKSSSPSRRSGSRWC
jgi:hypothetical protein